MTLTPDDETKKSNVATLITNKSDVDLAEEYTKRLEEAYKPAIHVLQEADANNLICNVGVGKNALGKFQILQLQILKQVYPPK